MIKYQQLTTQLREWHRRAVIVDGHMDTFGKVLATGIGFLQRYKSPSRFSGTFIRSHPEMRLSACRSAQAGQRHIDFPRLRRGGVDLQFTAIYTPPTYQSVDATLYVLRMLTTIRKTIKESKGKIIPILSARDLTRIGHGKYGFLISIEGGNPLDGNLKWLETFYHLGVRALGLTHNRRNELGDGIDVKRSHGLTSFGKEIVKRMNKLRMLIDIAHLNKAGFYDVLRANHGPIISSHSGVRALCDIPRNLDDDQIKEITKRNGVIGIFYIPEFLRQQPNPVRDKKQAKQANRLNRSTVSDVVDHIRYIADKFGVDYVGLGSDFDGYDGTTVGLEDVTALPNLTAELFHRGFTKPEVAKILGGNFRRVLSQVLP